MKYRLKALLLLVIVLIGAYVVMQNGSSSTPNVNQSEGIRIP